eukprot:403361905
MWGFGVFFSLIAMVTIPIWITMVVLSSPFMIAGVLLFKYTDVFNPVIKLLVRYIFGSYTNFYDKKDHTLLNFGYADMEAEDGVFLKTYRDKFDALRIQLYNYIVMRFGGVDSLNGLSLLETGCGRGGGLRYLAKELNPQQAIGIDICKSQIDYCQKHWISENLNLNFVQQDAENLEPIISRNTMDYVVDIENSHLYPNKDSFYRQVNRALKKDGVFLYGAMVPAFLLKSFEAKLDTYFDIEKSEEITQEVLRALKLGTPEFNKFIAANFPRWSHWLIKQFFGMDGSFLFKLMDNRMIVYKAYQCTKKKQN